MRASSSIRRLAILALAVVALADVSTTYAHGRAPQALQLAVHPSDPDVIVAVTTFGLLRSDDGGAVWRWLCATGMGLEHDVDPRVAVMGDGTVIAASLGGIRIGEESACMWATPDAEPATQLIADQQPVAGAANSSLVVTSRGDGLNSVFRTDNAGRSWDSVGGPNVETIFESLQASSPQAQTIYLSAVDAEAGPTEVSLEVFRSTNSGVSWNRRVPLGLVPQDRHLWIRGVDPREARRFLAVAEQQLADGTRQRLLLSTDLGVTVAPVLALETVQGLVWSDDGAKVWVGGGQNGGLWFSEDAGQSFALRNSSLSIFCLASIRGELWACTDNSRDGFGIARSADGGLTFQPVLRFSAIAGLLSCAAGSNAVEVCRPELSDLIVSLGLDPSVARVETINDTSVVSTPSGRLGGGSGCSLSADRSADRSNLSPVLWLFLMATWLRVAAWHRKRVICG